MGGSSGSAPTKPARPKAAPVPTAPEVAPIPAPPEAVPEVPTIPIEDSIAAQRLRIQAIKRLYRSATTKQNFGDT